MKKFEGLNKCSKTPQAIQKSQANTNGDSLSGKINGFVQVSLFGPGVMVSMTLPTIMHKMKQNFDILTNEPFSWEN